MSFIEAAILGLIQGLTEFLPISSSAHLRIAGEFLPSATDPGATFTAITQIGTEIAVMVFFWKDITRIIGKWFRHFGAAKGRRADASGSIPRNDPDVRMGWLIIIGTVPIVLAGFFLQEYIRDAFRSLWIVAIVLIVFGLILGVADWLGKRTRELTDLTYPHGILYGLGQMLALVPGVSRSGATTTVGLALGYTRPAAARYAFLLAIPAVIGAGVFELQEIPDGDNLYGWGPTVVATVVSFVVGYAAIAWLLRYVTTHSYTPFVLYRVALGIATLVLLATGVLVA